MKSLALYTSLAFCLAVIISVVLIIIKKTEKEFTVNYVSVGIPVNQNGTAFVDGAKSMLYSENGETWYDSSGLQFYDNSIALYDESAVYYGKDKWVATSVNTVTDKNIIYSEDGKEWKASFRNDGLSIFYATSFYGGRGVYYHNDLWVAVGKDADTHNNILYSNNGICWDVATLNNSGEIFETTTQLDGGCDVRFGKDKWVAVGKSINDENILYSTNGISWEIATIDDGISAFKATGSDNGGRGLYYSAEQDLWVAVGKDDISNIMISSNGISWRRITATVNGVSIFSDGNAGGKAISHDPENNIWIAVGDSANADNSILYSKNLFDWEPVKINNQNPFNDQDNGQDVIYDSRRNLWLAAGNGNPAIDGSCIIYSSNGTSWNTTIKSNGTSFPYGTNAQSVGHALAYRN
jgi:hypothetical protein